MRRLIRVLALALAPALLGAPPPALADFERAELEQMLAPIALYPDSVLSHVLIAATYPDQVEDAARWSRRHPDLSGEAAVDAVDRYDWDPSVKALTAFPDILARMDEDPDWTADLGDAFLDQEADVMDSVQTLRDRAYDAGRLESLEYVRVVREREYIYIEPALRHVVYIPYYDPWYVYGSWWWPAHPPYCWRTWRGHPVSYYPRGFHWGIGFHIEPTFYFTSFHWPARHVVVTHPRPNWRPLYSGRDVAARQPEVRHWREARGPAVRVERRQPGPRVQPGRPGQRDDRRPRPEQGQERQPRPEQRPERQQRPEHRGGEEQPRPRAEREERSDRSQRRSELRAADVERRLERRDEHRTERAPRRPERPGSGFDQRRERGAAPAQPRPSSPVARDERREETSRREDAPAPEGARPEPRPRRDERAAEAPGRGPGVSMRREGPSRAAERRERGNEERPRDRGRGQQRER